MLTVLYSDGTPGLTNACDRRGRLISVFCNGTTTTLTNNDAGLLVAESYAGGTLAGLAITNRYDSWLRRVTNGLTFNGSFLAWSTNAYDAASRLAVVGDASSTATYSYPANSPLVSQIVFKQGGTPVMTTTKQYDKLNRLLMISSTSSARPRADPIALRF